MSSRPSWTLGEAAERCGVSRSTVRRYRESDKFPNAFKDGSGAWKIPLEDLLAVGWSPAGQAQTEPVSVPAERVSEQSIERVVELERALELERVRREAAEQLNDQIQGNLDDLRKAMRMIEGSPMSAPVSLPERTVSVPAEHPTGERVEGVTQRPERAGGRGLWGRLNRLLS